MIGLPPYALLAILALAVLGWAISLLCMARARSAASGALSLLCCGTSALLIACSTSLLVH